MKTLIPISESTSIVSFNDDPCACLIPCGHLMFYHNSGHTMSPDVLDDVGVCCDVPVGHVAG